MDVQRVAHLANLTLTPEESLTFASQFSQTLETVNLINELDTSTTNPTSQVTGLTNVTRSDSIDLSRQLTANEATSQAASVRDGYFVVPSVFDAQ